jgi:phospholipase C
MPGLTRSIGSAAVAAFFAAATLIGAAAPARAATTPIEHLVVIYNENVSFDHYFATYPYALNPYGEPRFTAADGTPAIDGLSGSLLTANPNSANPFRLTRAQSVTCDNDHAYTSEQKAFNAGAMDKFIQFTSCPGNTAMGYYDGNTVTALWNYAQHYAMTDTFFGTVFGPSLPGHINLISGNTHGATPELSGKVVDGTVIAGPNATGDECGNRDPAATITFGGAPNIGTLLSAKGVSWGYFQGGFRPTGSDAGGAVCDAKHTNAAGALIRDYVPHHEPFQYYDATRNPTHKAPASAADIGHDDPPGGGEKVNHQYDIADFDTALETGNVPAVSFLKPPASQDGHAGYSGPLDEQRFLVETINAIQASSIWPDTAIVIAYDDSDGWYDHVASPIVNSSANATYDALDGAGQCHGPSSPPVAGGYALRCGYGPRLPLLVVSPYAKVNKVSKTVRDQTSILRFIEDNWDTGRIGDSSFDDIPSGKPTLTSLFDFTPGAARAPKLVLDPATGNVPGAAETPPPPPEPTPLTPLPLPVPSPAPVVTLPPVARKAVRGFTARVTPARDRRAPYVFTVRGRLTPPPGVACGGPVRVTVRAGRRTVATRSTRVKASCAWSLKVRFASARRLGSGRLALRARFLGTAQMLPRTARALTVRAR